MTNAATEQSAPENRLRVALTGRAYAAATAARADALTALTDAIIEARRQGTSISEIAEWSGLNRGTVHRMLRAQQ